MTDIATAPVSETPAAAPVVTEAPATPNQGTYVPGEQVSAPSDDTESRARAMGWVPKEDYKGNPDNWRDAGEFVRRGEEILPIVQERNRDLTRRLAELEGRLNQKDAEYKTGLQKLEGMTVVALQRQREQLLGSYEAAMRQAAATADVERYDQLSRDREQAVHQFDKRIHETVSVQAQPQNQRPPEAEAWIQRNSWFNKDPALQMEAQAIHIALQQDHPHMPLADNLARVEQTIKQRYPQKFGMQPQQQAAHAVSYGAVESGGSRLPSGNGNRQRGASDLPADARAQAEKFVKQGLFKDVNEYARDYFAQ